jgi:type I restriction enzyme S subunit
MLLSNLNLLAQAPNGVARLRELILTLAVQGKLVAQDPKDEPASELLKKIRAEKDKLILDGKIKRDKPLPPIAEDEQPFALPQGWEVVRLGGVIELVSGQHLGPNEYVEGLGARVPYLTGPAEFGLVSPEPSRSTNERRAIAIQADILITVKGSGVGKLNVVTHPEIAISRQLMAIRPVKMDSEFLMIVLQTMALHFQEKSVGIAIPGIGRDDVTLALIGLPPLAEQSRIVTRVAQLRRLCADLRQRLAASQSTQAHLAEVLVQDVG